MALSYKISGSTQVQVTFQRRFEEFGDSLQSSVVNLDFLHSGVAFKLPIFCYSQKTNTAALAMTCLLFSAANAVALGLLSRQRRKVDKDSSPQFVIFFGRYMQLLDKAEVYLRKNSLAYNRTLSHETDCRGLIIKEAYFGLADHIHLIDAGIDFSLPQSPSQYEKCQVIPVTKQLQMLVKDSKLELKPEHFKPKKRTEEEKRANPDEEKDLNQGMFNPAIHRHQRVLVYLRFDFKGIEQVVLYDPKRDPPLTIPRDVM